MRSVIVIKNDLQVYSKYNPGDDFIQESQRCDPKAKISDQECDHECDHEYDHKYEAENPRKDDLIEAINLFDKHYDHRKNSLVRGAFVDALEELDCKSLKMDE